MINISTIVRALCQNVMWRTTYTHLVDLAPPTLVPLEPCNMLLPFTSQETVRIKNSIVVHTGTSVHSGTLDRESGKHATYEALRKCVDAEKLTDRTILLPRMTNEGKTSRMIIWARLEPCIKAALILQRDLVAETGTGRSANVCATSICYTQDSSNDGPTIGLFVHPPHL